MSSKLGPRFNDFVISLVTIEHRFDLYFRDAFNSLFQRPIVEVAQLLLRILHRGEGLGDQRALRYLATSR
jgi:hypothetical protein